MNDKYDYILGIDPDIEKGGFSLLDVNCKAFEFVSALSFVQGVKSIDALAARGGRILVVIEDSDISTNWHIQRLLYSSQPIESKLRTAAAIGRSAGLCHATARLLREYAESCGLDVLMQKPLKKCWKGQDGKITQAEAEYFMQGLPKRCNQECRDSALIAWVVAGLPVRVKV